MITILSQLPGARSKQLQREQANIATRACAGDTELERALPVRREVLSEITRQGLLAGVAAHTAGGVQSEPGLLQPYAGGNTVARTTMEQAQEQEPPTKRQCTELAAIANEREHLEAKRARRSFDAFCSGRVSAACVVVLLASSWPRTGSAAVAGVCPVRYAASAAAPTPAPPFLSSSVASASTLTSHASAVCVTFAPVAERSNTVVRRGCDQV
eukprot:g43393.t1